MENVDLLLIDGDNLSYYCHDSDIFNKYGLRSGLVINYINKLFYFIKKFNPKDTIICWDGGKYNPIRLELLPTYKLRPERQGSDCEQINRLHYLLGDLGIKQVKLKAEADDIIAYITKVLNNNILILSADKDFLQLVSSRVSVFNFKKDRLIEIDNFQDTGFLDPEYFLSYLCLVGDQSDNISGLSGIGDVYARKFLENWKLEDIPLKVSDCIDYGKVMLSVFTHRDSKENIRQIKKLISLRGDWIGLSPEITRKIRNIIFCNPVKDIQGFMSAIEDQGLIYKLNLEVLL